MTPTNAAIGLLLAAIVALVLLQREPPILQSAALDREWDNAQQTQGSPQYAAPEVGESVGVYASNVDKTQAAPEPITAQEPSQEIAIRTLHRALYQSVWGPPAWCNVRQQIEVYGQKLSSFGTFIRAGQGSGKLKLSLQFPAGDSMNTLLQICDGQRLQTIEALGGQRRRTIVDLAEVRSRLTINDETINDPTTSLTTSLYLAIGGQAESLRKLCQQYEWYEVKSGKYAEKEVWLLSGRLATVPQAVRAFAFTDQQLHQENVSGLLPTQVGVVIGKPDTRGVPPYWMYQVEHYKPRDASKPQTSQQGLKLVTEWADPRLINHPIAPDVFEAASSNDPWGEETEDYLPPPLNVASIRREDGHPLSEGDLR